MSSSRNMESREFDCSTCSFVVVIISFVRCLSSEIFTMMLLCGRTNKSSAAGNQTTRKTTRRPEKVILIYFTLATKWNKNCSSGFGECGKFLALIKRLLNSIKLFCRGNKCQVMSTSGSFFLLLLPSKYTPPWCFLCCASLTVVFRSFGVSFKGNAKKFRFNQGDFSPASRSFASYRACIGLEFLLFY